MLTPQKGNTYDALVIGFLEGRPWADMGTLLIVHFKVLVFPHRWGNFFLPRFPVFYGEAKQPTRLEDSIYFSS